MNGFFDAGADTIVRLYASYQLALVGLFSAAIGSELPTSTAVRRNTYIDAHGAQGAFLSYAMLEIDNAVKTIVTDALKTAQVDANAHIDDIMELSEQMREDVIWTLNHVSHRDLSTVLLRLREFAMQVAARHAADMSYNGALVKTRIEHATPFIFTQKDRAARTWKSVDYLRASVRGHLVTTWVETYLYGLTQAGIDLARVRSDNEFNDIVFSITGDTKEYPSFQEIKSKVWHPNSRAGVERV